MKWGVKILTLLLILTLLPISAAAQNKDTKTKFYNFDDLLIDGKIQKPKVLWVDARQKVKFQRLLKLKKDFMPKLRDTKKDMSLR
jgi:hypothetical protein|tara:strand:- start:97 stop:351 length:255 start_codon:yes stop_codon:yes gene_type:complete